MNRTNLCIRMLQLLKARGKMNTTQLATELEVNPRNIREFKKELVLAGYNVEEVKGRYGGYILNDEYDLPVTIFSDEQKDTKKTAITLGILSVNTASKKINLRKALTASAIISFVEIASTRLVSYQS